MKKIFILLMMVLPILGLAQEEEKESVFEIFDVAQKAEFPVGAEGLQRFLAENIIYPAEALENDHQGMVMLMFVINKKGNVVDAEIMNKGVCHKSLEKEALKVIKSTSGMWKPAIQRGEEVNMRFRMPVKFQIFESEPKKKEAKKTLRKK
ncbi:MAG: protein TonB [Bacteroidia bacterium]|jgi:protein TonB